MSLSPHVGAVVPGSSLPLTPVSVTRWGMAWSLASELSKELNNREDALGLEILSKN